MHSKNKGNIGELICAVELSKSGYSVFKELGDLSKIDLIAEKDGKLLRFQCKAYTPKDGVLTVSLRKCGPKYRVTYDFSKLDYFSVFDLENHHLYFVPVVRFKGLTNSFNLRISEESKKEFTL